MDVICHNCLSKIMLGPCFLHRYTKVFCCLSPCLFSTQFCPKNTFPPSPLPWIPLPDFRTTSAIVVANKTVRVGNKIQEYLELHR